MNKNMSLHMRLGPVMLDVAGTALTDDDRKRLTHPLTGGVILFARNFQSPQQLMALTDEIHALRTPALLIAVDHEGGRVQRFRTDGFTHLPRFRASVGSSNSFDEFQLHDNVTVIGRPVVPFGRRRC